MKLVASYVRLSDKDKDMQGMYSESINHQRLLIKNFASENNLKIDKEYIDDGCSGGNFERPAFNELLKDIESGNIAVVITKDFSRLGRNFVDTAYYISEYFNLNDVRYISINDFYDSNNNDTTINELVVGIKSLVNDKFLKDTSIKVRNAKKQKSKEKNFLGFIAPYGYKKIKDNDGRITFVIDEQASPIIRRIFNDVSSGKSAKEISDELNDENVMTPFEYLKMKESKNKNYYHKWNKSIIYRIIKNIEYTGNLFYRKSNAIDYHNKNKRQFIPYDERDIIKDTHEPIISMELFNSANANLRKSSREKCNYDGIYKGLICCGECGKPLKVTNSSKRECRTIYFYCKHYKEGEAIFSFGIYLSKLDKIVKDILKDIINNYLSSDDVVKKIVDDILKDDKVESKLKNLQNNITHNRQLIKNQYIMKTRGKISLEEFLKFKEEKDDIIKWDEKLIEQLNNKYNNDSLIELVKVKYKAFAKDEEVFNMVVKELIEKIVLYRDKTIKINFNFKSLDTFSIKLY